MADLPDGYYAVPDPDDDTTMTYWRVRAGVRTRWPAKAWYGPGRPLRADAPGPKGSPAYVAWMHGHFERMRDWNSRVGALLAQDPAAAARRFAELSTRCCACGRALTDEKSKVFGLGSECRTGIRTAALAALLTPQIARAHAAWLADGDPDA